MLDIDQVLCLLNNKCFGFSLDLPSRHMGYIVYRFSSSGISRAINVNGCEPGLYAVLIAWIGDRELAVRSVTEPNGSEDIPIPSTQARFFSFVFL